LIKPDLRYYLITVGGRRGRHPRIGRELVALESEDAVVETVERIVAWIYRRAWSGRLLSEQLDDINFEAFKKEIIETAGKSTETGNPH
ncbi:MAG TPA: nitrite reductase, partial [Methanomicrobiales archaeon]|nr:nitrite reductase [Methanomicrobiales archaeon]